MELVLFDFDGTLTKKDSLWAFLIHAKGPLRVALGMIALSPWFGLYATRIIGGATLKERLLRWHFKGDKQEQMDAVANDFVTRRLPEMMQPEIFAKFLDHTKRGAEVCIVSASCDVWIRPFCAQHNCSYLTTEMEFREGLFTGRFRTPNCNNEEKPARIRAAYNLSDFSKIIAYGNSSADLPMFALAHETYMV